MEDKIEITVKIVRAKEISPETRDRMMFHRTELRKQLRAAWRKEWIESKLKGANA